MTQWSWRRHAGWLLGVLLAASSQSALASSGGITGQTTAGCNSCHGSAGPTAGKVTIAGSTTPIEGIATSYSVTVTRASTSKRTGFNLGLSNVATGSLTAGSGSQKIGNELTHTAPLNGTVFNVTFTGAEVGANTAVTLRACGQEVDNNGASSGDGPYGCDTHAVTVQNNIAPVSNAGPDQSVTEGTLVTLTSAASTDTEGTTLARSWSRTGGTCATITLSSSTATSPTFTAPSLSQPTTSCTATFQVQVTDNNGVTGGKSDATPDSVTITVNNSPSASAGADQTVTEGSVVTLNSSASFDPGGGRVWTQTAPVSPMVTLSSTTTTSPTFTAPTQAFNTSTAFTFRVRVSNDASTPATSDDFVTVTVNDVAVGNANPVANAGSDQSVNEGAAVTLNGSASSDPESGALTYAWTQTGGSPSVTLTNANSATPSFTAPTVAANATLTFELTVTDPVSRTSTDTVQVTVNNGPTANAGADFAANEDTVVMLDGTASTDAGGAIASYAWVRTAGAAVTLSGANTATPSFTAPLVAPAGTTVTFQLTVTDNGPSGGLTANDTVVVAIDNVNQSPVANAGNDQAVAEGDSVNLDGTASSDDVAVTDYAWEQTAGPTATLSGANTATPSFTTPSVPAAGATLTFQLTATDAENASTTDTVDVAVSNVNVAPVANAGANVAANEGASAQLDGTASADPDSDGSIATYAWTQIAGTTVTLDDASSAMPTFTAPSIADSGIASETLTFTLSVSDELGAPAAVADSVDVIVNNGPTAEAGNAQVVVEGNGVTLDGSASTDAAGGGITTYQWVQTAGTTATLSGAMAAMPTFTAPAVSTVGGSATLTFTLTVTDAGGATSMDAVSVQVDDVAVGNADPIANAGTDQATNEGAPVTLNGSASSDPEMGALTYAWTQTGGLTATLSGATTAMPTFTAPTIVDAATASATLTFSLTVTDPVQRTSTDTVTITVNNGPTANAGADASAAEGAAVALDGGASFDPGGSITSYAWTQSAGPTVSLSGADSATPSFTAPAVPPAGDVVTLLLTVTDNGPGGGLTGTDTVDITITNVNQPPVANAGSDQSAAEGATVTLDGSASTDDVAVTQYQWQQTGGPNVVLAAASSAMPTFTAPPVTSAGATLTFELTATDAESASSTDTVIVTVTNVNVLPVANAGANVAANESTLVTLNGSTSSDADGSLAAYQWQQTAGTPVTLASATTAMPTFTAPAIAGTVVASETLTFTLTVTDELGAASAAVDSVDVVVNNGPVAEAGPSRNVRENTLVALDGSASADAGGSGALTYAWEQTAGTPVMLSALDVVAPTFTAPNVATVSGNVVLTFTLTVRDAGLLAASDSVTITVNDDAVGDLPPAAAAGVDRTVNEGSGVVLDGSASSDPEATALTYQWTQTAGASVTLMNAATATPTFTAPVIADAQGANLVLEFTLTVTDAVMLTGSDTITVTVNNGPTANAGADFAANESTTVMLNGSASSDPGGAIASYAWVRTAGAAVTLSGANTATPSFTAPTVGPAGTTVTFQLTVTDNGPSGGLTANDTVVITINNVNQPPVANAGSDQSVAEGASVNLDGTASTDDVAVTGYAWLQTAGTTAVLSGANTATPSFTTPSVPAAGETLTFRLTATDAEGASTTDTVNVTVSNVNLAPVANAGANVAANEGAGVQLDGTASADPDSDGSIATYAWTQTAGTSVTLNNANSATPAFTAPLIADAAMASETLTFTLSVSDELGAPAAVADSVDVIVNNGPTADAGNAQTVVEGNSVTLDGSASTDAAGGGITTYQWVQTAGTTATLSGAMTAMPTFTAPTVSTVGGSATLTFALTVTDAGGATSMDTVSIQVDDVAVGNADPIANAGADQATNEGALVTLNGSASSDPEMGSLVYAWTQTGGPTATLSGATTVMPTFTAPSIVNASTASTTLTFSLTVTDPVQRTSSDTVSVTVNNGPTANAGADSSANERTLVTLNGGASFDPGGSIASYAWTQIAGPPVTLSDASAAAPTFTAPEVLPAGATLTFSLQVADAGALTATDTVSISVVHVNRAPVAAAGADRAVAEGTAASLDGTASSDAEGALASYLWTQTAGPTVMLGGASSAVATFTAPAVMPAGASLTFRLRVTDDEGVSALDTIVISVTNVNQPPVADAGLARTVREGAAVSLDASASSDDDGIAGYQWEQTAGTPLLLTGADSPAASFVAPAIADAGVASEARTFRITVTDGDGLTATASVTITVDNAPVAVIAPLSNVVEGAEVRLDGSAAFDPGGGSLRYVWEQLAGPTVTLTGADTAMPTFTAPAVAAVGGSSTLEFRLRVSDSLDASAEASVTVTVDDIAVGNAPPTADAGAAVMANEGASVTLSGAASSDPEGGPLSYAWTQTGGAAVVLSGADTATPTFMAPEIADAQATSPPLTFTLQVTDNVQRADTDTVTVFVNNGPTANAGNDFTADEGSTVTLEGGGTSDPEGALATVAWTQVAGPAVTLTNASTMAPTFVAPQVTRAGALLVFEVSATDGGGLVAMDRVEVTIANVNGSPVAAAGADQQVDEGATVTLDASASSDDDAITSYLWEQIDEWDVVLVNSDAAIATFVTNPIGPAGESYTFRVTVTDSEGVSAQDSIIVNVRNVNRAPVADAGPAQTVQEGALVTLSGSNSSDDEGIVAFRWTQTSGTSVTLSDATTAAPTFSAPLTGPAGESLQFTLRVTDAEDVAASATTVVNVSNNNLPPVADAGVDQTRAEGLVVTLDARNSRDPDDSGTGLTYRWQQTAGPAVTLIAATTATPRFTAPLTATSGATLTFTVTVTDDGNLIAVDSVIVNVTNVDQPPIANAGPDISAAEGASVRLDGLNSADADGMPSAWRWRQTSGTAVTLSAPDAPQPTFTAPLVTANVALTFELTVTGDAGLSDTDTVVVNVLDTGGRPPTADAGAGQTVGEGSLVTLDGSQSRDSDGTIARFAWRQTDGAVEALLSDPSVAMPTFVAPGVPTAGATLTFELTVTDNDGLQASDSVLVTVGNVAVPPVADAGIDATATEGDTVTLDASGSNDAGGSISARWEQTAGPAITLSDPLLPSPGFVAPPVTATIVLTFRLTVTDEDGLAATDTVNITVSDNGIGGFAADVTTTRTSSGTAIGLRTDSGSLVMLEPVPDGNIGEQVNRPLRFAGDLVSTHIRTATAGATVNVTYFLDTPAPADFTWVKYQPDGGWIDYSANATFSADRRQVTVRLVDGGVGDDDGVANGVIVDPSGLASFTRQAQPIPAGGSGGLATSDGGGGGRFGCSLGRADGGIDGFLLLLGLLALGGAGRELTRRHRITPEV